MKIAFATKPARAPRAPSFQISTEAPKLRIPFLSLLVESRSLKKWIFMWVFCAYLALCWACYFWYEQPRLDHETYIRFGADSPTYWDQVKYRSEHVDRADLIQFDANYFGPVLIGTMMQTGIGVAIFNMLLFFIAIEIACSIPGVDRYRLLFLLMISAETAPVLVTLNKEILLLLSAFLLAKYVYSQKRSWLLLGAVCVVSFLTRWEQIAIVMLFLFVQRKGSVFGRNPRFAVVSVIAVLTLIYPVLAILPGSPLTSFTRFAKDANTIAKLNNIQAHFGFPLVVVPKIIMDLSGQLITPSAYFGQFAYTGFYDIHTWFIIPVFSLVLIPTLAVAFFKGKLHPRRPVGLLIIVYLSVVAVTPFVQPRYNYFVYVLLCLELAKQEPPAKEAQFSAAPVLA